MERLDEAGRAMLFTQARTANTFDSTPVTDDELAGIWDLAQWPPTAANFQPLRVVYVRTPEGKARLLPHLADGNKDKTASAPAVAILARDTRFHEHIPTVFPARAQMREAFEDDAAGRDQVSTFNSALQVGYFLLAVRAQGLAAGPMGGFDRETLDREFFADGRLASVLVVNIGHPGTDPWFDRLPRLEHEDVVQYL
ncbi:malonic semialdehyde reductase [Leekyejoonella antrihumi]|uniref:Malonic semialdehyde reductase n=2 Tax=Leekyejoonella antrihumi TaxID=1660198 RepID=A0A563E0N9_9MICO|nr:malonic semialdehyde reductase [Leekyejoonella antrihumi]